MMQTNFRNLLRVRGWDVGQSKSQIVPILVGTPERAVGIAHALRRQGIWAPAIRPPSVPQDQSLIRVSLTAAHSPDMAAQLLDALDAVSASGGT